MSQLRLNLIQFLLMEFFKKLIYIFTAILVSCGSNDDEMIVVGDFSVALITIEGSDDAVSIDWEINRPSNSVVEDIKVFRNDTYTSSTSVVDELIANLPSNSLSFIDTYVPYTNSVSYTIEVRFSFKNERGEPESLLIRSNRESYFRPLITFNRVPFQIEKDYLNNNIFHIFDRDDVSKLVRYNASTLMKTNTIILQASQFYLNKFQISTENKLIVSNLEGSVKFVNPDDYNILDDFNVPNNDIITAFASIDDRFYYGGENSFFYSFQPSTGENFRVPLGWSILRTINIPESLLFIISDFNNAGAGIVNVIDNCPNSDDCSIQIVRETSFTDLDGFSMDGSNIDPNIFVINEDLGIFISGRSGSIFDFNTFKQIATLEALSNETYFDYAFDSENNIYAAVQAKKEIHVFDASTYDLLEIIRTRTYPIHILIPDGDANQIQVVGSYKALNYFSYGSGSSAGRNFDFKELSVIELDVNNYE